jgi:hypothetical protein
MQLRLWAARHAARWGIVVPFLICVLSDSSTQQVSAAPHNATLRVPPKAVRYRYEDDTFAHQESAFSIVRKTRPGGELGYTGNRLNQFHYIGPPGQGGMYDAMRLYKSGRPLDPKNYQYRSRY